MQALADMSEFERKVALERYKLLEPHLQNGRELRSVSKGSGVSFRALQQFTRRRLFTLKREEAKHSKSDRDCRLNMRPTLEIPTLFPIGVCFAQTKA